MAKSNSASSDVGKMSFLQGPTKPELQHMTLSELLRLQAIAGPDRDAVVFPQYGQRSSYKRLYSRSIEVAKGLMSAGVQRGDHVAIMAGNCPQYTELIWAGSHVGAPLVLMNNTYTATELRSGLKAANCKFIFMADWIGKISQAPSLTMLQQEFGGADLPDLRKMVLLKPADRPKVQGFVNYEDVVADGSSVSAEKFNARLAAVDADDVCALLFTSGTTGNPKATLLTHSKLLNNGRFIGDRMRLTAADRICCPPQLFHLFGLVLGLLAIITHGSTIVFPSETFDPALALEALEKEKCTGLHGVPAMFSAELEVLQGRPFKGRLRTGTAAGSCVPRQLMEDIKAKFHMLELTNTYGMSETSPASFMTFTDDPLEKRLSTVGSILPHTSAKIIDKEGNIVPRGVRGELCVAGYLVMKGYWRNPQKTAEIMRKDENGVEWIHSGDEALFDADGYCQITGRIKDTIIRGGENIYPLEIEERLVQHEAVSQACVVGLPDKKYNEIVGAFILRRNNVPRPSDQTLQEFVRQTLGRHKTPVHIFWLEPGDVFPQTGSGKIQKHILRDRGAALIAGREGTLEAKL